MKALVSSGDLDRTGDQPIQSYLNLNHRVMFFLYLDVCSEKESVEEVQQMTDTSTSTPPCALVGGPSPWNFGWWVEGRGSSRSRVARRVLRHIPLRGFRPDRFAGHVVSWFLFELINFRSFSII